MTEKETALANVTAAIEKNYGKGSIMSMTSGTIPGVEFRSTGILSLDKILGGGFGKGRIVEIYGQESCIDGDTFIQYQLRSDGKTHNHKGGSISRLWERFHGKPASGDGRGKYLRPATIGVEFYTTSINEENRVFQNRIIDVIKTGEKECFRLTTLKGLEIITTADHKFFTGTNYKALKNLEPGEEILVHTNTPFTVDHANETGEKEYRKYLYVKNHPIAGIKIAREGNKEYKYYRLANTRAVVEANMNNLQLDTYIERLNEGKLQGLKFLSRDDHVHHIDEDITNDSLDNLALISASEHGRLHALERHNNLRFKVVPDIIESIVPVGKRETYDIKMESPFNNYIANEFVTHNSGKSTLALHAIAEAQKHGGTCAYIDAEHAFDINYAKNLEVNPETLLLSQPDSAEQGLNIVDMLTASGAVDVIVIDSVAALVPLKELEGEIGDATMGLAARLMSQTLRVITAKAANTGTTIIFINQMRMKFVMFGNPNTTTGGNALKFYASQRLDISNTSKQSESIEAQGNTTRIKVVKNKLAPPFKEAEFILEFGKGINKYDDLLNCAIESEVIEKSGMWYSFAGEKIGQGKDNAIKSLMEDKKLHKAVRAKLA